MHKVELEVPAARYLHLLVAGRSEDLLHLFPDEPVIDDPIKGHIVGREAAVHFVETYSGWLREREARVELQRITRGADRTVAELLLHLVLRGEPVALPVAVAGDHAGLGSLQAVRIYHSMWPLTGSHRIRPPLLRMDRDLELPDVIERYQRALAAGSLNQILEVFEPDGYAREPSGGEYVHRGEEGLREFYGALFAVGGVGLEHCSATDDGVCCAVEYNVMQWGSTALAPQAGIAVYERGRSGLLAAARIYDDVAVEEGPAGTSAEVCAGA